VAVVVAVYSAAGAGHLAPALMAGGLVTGSGTVYRWLVEGDNVLGVETALGAVLLMTVALVGDAARLRHVSSADPAPGPDPEPVPPATATAATEPALR
jgi:hypothetical protein